MSWPSLVSNKSFLLHTHVLTTYLLWTRSKRVLLSSYPPPFPRSIKDNDIVPMTLWPWLFDYVANACASGYYEIYKYIHACMHTHIYTYTIWIYIYSTSLYKKNLIHRGRTMSSLIFIIFKVPPSDVVDYVNTNDIYYLYDFYLFIESVKSIEFSHWRHLTNCRGLMENNR